LAIFLAPYFLRPIDAATAAGFLIPGLFASSPSSFANRPPPPSFIDLPMMCSIGRKGRNVSLVAPIGPRTLHLRLELPRLPLRRRHLLPGLPRFREADRDRLLLARHLLARLRPRVQRASFPFVHRGFHARHRFLLFPRLPTRREHCHGAAECIAG